MERPKKHLSELKLVHNPSLKSHERPDPKRPNLSAALKKKDLMDHLPSLQNQKPQKRFKFNSQVQSSKQTLNDSLNGMGSDPPQYKRKPLLIST